MAILDSICKTMVGIATCLPALWLAMTQKKRALWLNAQSGLLCTTDILWFKLTAWAGYVVCDFPSHFRDKRGVELVPLKECYYWSGMDAPFIEAE